MTARCPRRGCSASRGECCRGAAASRASHRVATGRTAGSCPHAAGRARSAPAAGSPAARSARRALRSCARSGRTGPGRVHAVVSTAGVTTPRSNASYRSRSTCSASRSARVARRTSRSRSRRVGRLRSSRLASRRCSEPARLGASFDAALDDAARSAPRLRPLADALLASDRLGAPVGPALARLAAEERAALRRQAEAPRSPRPGTPPLPPGLPRPARVRVAHGGPGSRGRALAPLTGADSFPNST